MKYGLAKGWVGKVFAFFCPPRMDHRLCPLLHVLSRKTGVSLSTLGRWTQRRVLQYHVAVDCHCSHGSWRDLFRNNVP